MAKTKTLSIGDHVTDTETGDAGVIQRFTPQGRAIVYMDGNGATLDFDPDQLELVPA